MRLSERGHAAGARCDHRLAKDGGYSGDGKNFRFPEDFSFALSEDMLISGHPASTRGALRAIVTTREAGMRWPREIAACSATRERTNDRLRT
jgi:hypothetical protein